MLGNDPQEFAIRLNFFRREAEILRSLETVPIVPRVFDFIHQGQTAHLVMEFIRGQRPTQDHGGERQQALSRAARSSNGPRVSATCCTTMHNQSPPIIHRDLKPDNIMLLEDQKSIKMIDFGTARDLGRTAKERMAGKTRVYTEGYAPPEQIVGKPEARSDLFALAATLYHLVTGKAPEGFYTAKELETQLNDPASPVARQQYHWFYELIADQPVRRRQRSLFLREGDQDAISTISASPRKSPVPSATPATRFGPRIAPSVPSR